jgi:hypothetical protein
VIYNPVVITTAQPLSASMGINNGEEEIKTLVPTSKHSFTEAKEFRHTASSIQPTLASDNQNCGDTLEELAVPLSSCSVLDPQRDTSAMISDNIALRYA